MCRYLARICSLVAAVLLLGALSPPMPLTGAVIRVDRLDPELQALATVDPAATYPVIVEASTPPVRAVNANTNRDRARQASGTIGSLGGTLRGELPLIGAAAGTLSGAAILSLATNPAVAYVSFDTLLSAQAPALATAYPGAVRAPQVWDLGYSGRGVTVAVLDSGTQPVDDLGPGGRRIVASVDFVAGGAAPTDPAGHGTHVAGIIAGDGTASSTNPEGRYQGLAPGANLAMVRVVDASGAAWKSTVIKGIQWAVQYRATHNIRVLNLSLGGKAATSYRVDPLNAAVEMAWRAGIVVVTAAGNDGPMPGTINTPGNDPYVITVGALDDRTTVDPVDDTVPDFSARGPTADFLVKPDLAAPGRRIVSLRVAGSTLDNLLPDRRVGTSYFRLTGTSMAAPVVAGVAALLLEKHPSLTPDEVKYVLMATARPLPGQDLNTVGSGMVDAYAALTSTERARANRKLRPSDGFARSVLPLLKGQLLSRRDSTYANGLGVRNVTWDNVTWDNVTWDNVTWDNVTWDNVTWDNVTWDNVTWDNVTWDNVTWDNVTWDTTVGAGAGTGAWSGAALD